VLLINYIGKALTHPNIASTIDLVRSHDAWNLVMEYCNRTLANVLDASPDGLMEYQADQIFRQLVDAVSCMHGEGIAHHDLKPSNIMFDAKGAVKIIDFGTAYRFVDPIRRIVVKRHGKQPCLALSSS
jgi:serine/threonine protein kinase